MDTHLRQVVEAHIEWCVRLVADIFDGKSLQVKTIGRDDVCVIGQWIRKREEDMGGLPEFEAFRKAHADFHRCAADAVSTALAGREDEALEQLEGADGCAQYSDELIDAFLRLEIRAAKSAEARSPLSRHPF